MIWTNGGGHDDGIGVDTAWWYQKDSSWVCRSIGIACDDQDFSQFHHQELVVRNM